MTVSLYEGWTTAAAIKTVAVPASGQFSFSGLAARGYVARVNVDSASGFASTWYPAAPVRSKAQLINLSSGADITGVVFRLQKTGTIKGVVTVPVSTIGGASTVTVSARMSVWQPQPGDDIVTVTTTAAADGSFSFDGLIPTQYLMSYTARAESGLSPVDGAHVYVDPGGEEKTAVTMLGSGTISGRVTLPAGAANYSAVTVYLYDTQQNLVAKVPVDDSSDPYGAGFFRFGRVAAGEFRVLFDSLDWGELVDKWYGNGAVFSAALPIVVTPGQRITGIDATLIRAASIAGTVTLPAGSTWANTSVNVSVHNVATGAVWTRTTNGDGSYRVTGLPPGNYRIKYLSSSPAVKNEWWNDKPDYPRATTIPLSYTQQLKRIDATLASTTAPTSTPAPPTPTSFSITGRVVAPGGASVPTSGVTVSLYEGWKTAAAIKTVSVPPSGQFSFTGLEARGYYVKVNADGPSGFASEWYPATPLRAWAKLVDLSNGKDATGLTVALQKTATISGLVRVPVGTIGGVSAVTVTLRSVAIGSRAPDETVTLTTAPAADGRFSFSGLIPDSYVLYYTARPDAGLLDSNTERNPLLARAGQETQTGQSMTGSGSITGRVRLPSGNSNYSALTAYLYDAQGNRVADIGVIPDRDGGGSFHFWGIPAGKFRVLIDSADWGELVDKWYENAAVFSAARTITLAPGQKITGIDSTLIRAASIAGTVTLPAGATWKNTTVTVSVHNVATGAVWTKKTNADGTYRVTGLPPGNYRIKYTSSSATVKSEWWNDQPDYARATTIPLSYTQQLKRVDVALDSASAPRVY